MLIIENQINSFFGLARRADDHALVVAKSLQPVLNVSGIVAEAARGFKAAVADEGSCSKLCDQFFFAVCLAAKERCFAQSVKSALMPSAVHQFMKCCAIILGSVFKPRELGKDDAISGWTI